MRIEATKKLFTVDEFVRMGEAGIFSEEERFELIDGEIIQMSPPGNRHVSCVDRATLLLVEALGRRAIVSVQNPAQLNPYSYPVPDIIVLKQRTDFYASQRRNPGDVLFMIEISDTSLKYDREVKRPRYAAAGIREFWIENLRDDVLLVYQGLKGKSYRTSLILRRDDSVSPQTFPEVSFKVSDLLG